MKSPPDVVERWKVTIVYGLIVAVLVIAQVLAGWLA